MDFDVEVKLAVYRYFAETAAPPTVRDLARRIDVSDAAVRESFARLRSQRLLLLEDDGESIRMAPPFSGVPTQHVVEAGGRAYYANCAWDALGIPAALHTEARVLSRCEQSGEPLRLSVGLGGPEPSSWLFHCPVPAAHWWDDLVFT